MNSLSPIDRLLRDFPKDSMTLEAESNCVLVTNRYKSGFHRESALESLVLGHMRDAFFYARKCSYGKLEDDELVSLSYSALVRAAEHFKPDLARFFAYAKPYIRGAICRVWQAKDTVKNAGGSEPLNLEVDSDTADQNDPSVDPEFSLISLHEKWDVVAPLMKALNKREKLVLTLYYSGGLNFREIGEQLNVTRAATQCTHSRALKKLRNALLRKKRLYE